MAHVLLVVSAAQAVDVVTSCDASCSSVNCELGRDLQCCANSNVCPDGSGPITLANGKNLDLDGNSIECFCGTLTCNGGSNNNALCFVASDCPGGSCENQTGCTTCGAAVTIQGSGSQVLNGAPEQGTIFGPWSPAVDCDGNSGTRVQKVTFVGIAGNGAVDCAQVDQNVFQGGGGTAIVTSGIADSDYIRDNHVDDYPTGILVTGTKGVRVDHNLVSLRRSDSSGIAGIDVSEATSTGLEVDHNVIMGVGTLPIDGNASGVFTENYCNPLSAECASCTKCATPTPPFEQP